MQRSQSILKHQLCDDELVVTDLTGYTPLQLDCLWVVDIFQGLENLRGKMEGEGIQYLALLHLALAWAPVENPREVQEVCALFSAN